MEHFFVWHIMRNETKSHDSNDDGFVDIPRVEQYNVWNRWAYMGDHYVFQAGIKALHETRNSGQIAHGNTPSHDLYEIGIKTNRYEAFTKNALYLSTKRKIESCFDFYRGTWHNQDANYGRKLYDVDQSNFLCFRCCLKRSSVSSIVCLPD